jgi:hypothetical protein
MRFCYFQVCRSVDVVYVVCSIGMSCDELSGLSVGRSACFLFLFTATSRWHLVEKLECYSVRPLGDQSRRVII